MDKRRRLNNPFKIVAKQVDCDFFSIQVRIESIGDLSQFYSLTCTSLTKYKDPRLTQCVAVTMDPIQLLAPISQARLVEALRTVGITVFAHENDRVASKTAGKRIHCDDLIKVFQTAGLRHVFAYGYGMKCESPKLFELLDKLSNEGGALDNVFDIGRTVACQDIPLFKVKSGSNQDLRLRQIRGADCYGLFKHIGRGYGWVTFETYLDHKVTIYQRWTHFVKASMDSKRKLLIPLTFKSAERFERNFSILLSDLASVASQLGGYRIEITAVGRTFKDALRSVPNDQFELDHWTRFGLIEKISISPTEVLDVCNRSKRELALRGYLNRRDSVKLSDEQRAVFVDLNNLIGVKMHFSFDRQLRMSGTTAPAWDHWPNVAIERSRSSPGGATFNQREMASWLKWRSALRGPFYTLTRVGGRVWEHKWGSNDGDINPEVNMTKFLKTMVKTVMEAGVRDWRREFVLWDTPRPLPEDFDDVIQNPRWMAQLEELFARNPLQRMPSESEDDILVEFARTHDPILAVGENRELTHMESASSDLLTNSNSPIPSSEPRRVQLRQSLLPVQRGSSESIVSQVHSRELAPRAQGPPEHSERETYAYPLWAVVSMSPELLRSVLRKAREDRVGNEYRARSMHLGDDKVIMEFYYQVSQAEEPPTGSPRGVKFWESQPRFCIFEAGSIANRWKGTPSRPGLWSLYPEYKARRDAENPRRLTEMDYIEQ